MSDVCCCLQYEANHPIVGDNTIVCDTKYYTAVRGLQLPLIQALCTLLHSCAIALMLALTGACAQVEDRPIVKEIKTYIREHHPIEKEFVVETRPTGQSIPYMRLFIC